MLAVHPPPAQSNTGYPHKGDKSFYAPRGNMTATHEPRLTTSSVSGSLHSCTSGILPPPPRFPLLRHLGYDLFSAFAIPEHIMSGTSNVQARAWCHPGWWLAQQFVHCSSFPRRRRYPQPRTTQEHIRHALQTSMSRLQALKLQDLILRLQVDAVLAPRISRSLAQVGTIESLTELLRASEAACSAIRAQ